MGNGTIETIKTIQEKTASTLAIKVGAIFYFFFNLLLDYVLIRLVYTTIILNLFTGLNQLIYTIMFAIFLITKTVVVPIIMTMQNKGTIGIKGKAITWFTMNIFIDYIIIEFVLDVVTPLLPGETETLVGAGIILFLLMKTGMMSIVMLFKEDED